MQCLRIRHIRLHRGSDCLPALVLQLLESSLEVPSPPAPQVLGNRAAQIASPQRIEQDQHEQGEFGETIGNAAKPRLQHDNRNARQQHHPELPGQATGA